jgi:iron(III) transport system ATP-binding protein
MMARTMGATSVSVTVRELLVKFGPTAAVDRASLQVEAGELFLLLGPSGCGKTTLLRALAGFVTADAGSIHFGAEEVTHLPPHLRRAGLVFQSFALWPHLSVAENVAFGLRELHVPRAEIAARVEDALASTHLPGYGPRRIDELSGGEQQRVALARALVVRPRCLLLDEPLSSLDARLRRSMREEIRRLCKEFGLTTIYVTHDQKEALAIADRLAVMEHGRILQVGTPGEIYRRPRSRAVAAFVGDTNLIAGRVLAVGPTELRVETALGAVVGLRDPSVSLAAGAPVWVSIRPECVRLAGAPAAVNSWRGRRTARVLLGEFAEHRVQVGEGDVAVTLTVFELNPGPGDGGDVQLRVAPADVVVLPIEPEEPVPT